MHGGKLAAGVTGEKIFIREKSRRLADSPIFNLKIFDAQIFAQIIGDDRQAARLCLACDQGVEGADRLTGLTRAARISPVAYASDCSKGTIGKSWVSSLIVSRLNETRWLLSAP
jgi:hypothetical protein